MQPAGANEIPIIIVLVLSFIGNIIGCGGASILTYIITVLLFFMSFFIAEPRYNEESRNEKIKFGRRICIASLIVGVLKVIFTGFLWYDFFGAIAMSMVVFILYKIFVNAVPVLTNYYEKMVFTLEEIMGAAVIITIAVCCLGNLQIFGFSIRNIIAIFIVLVLGWKNGMLVGTASGVTIGVTLGIVAETEPIIIAAYAISGLIAGLLYRFGKIGVIVGFVLGNILLTYLQNGGIENIIVLKEILVAGIGLLAVPKNIKLNIADILGNKQLLPIMTNRGLNRSKETVEKLEDVSKAVEEIANSYIEEEKEEDLKKKNKQIFITELLNNTDNLENNILYENITNTEGKIVNDIFEKLLEQQYIKEENLIQIFANNNNYIVGFEDEEKTVKNEVRKMTQAINNAYRISKMNFILSVKLKEEKKNISHQLNGVSKAISSIAEDMQQDMKSEIKNDKLYATEKEILTHLLKEKEILTQDIFINKKEEDRFNIEIYIEQSNKKNKAKLIQEFLEKIFNEKFKLKEKTKIEKQKCKKYVFISEDKFHLEFGQAIAIKDGMKISGDSILNIKLKDEKQLIVISDGMGSGQEAKKSSQMAISMLKKLLDSGFNKESSIDLINTNILNLREDVFATLDIAIIDLYKGTIEFIKNGSTPTYLKNKKKIQTIKSNTLPTGIVKNAKAQVTEKQIENEEIVLMCSDGIIDSNVAYKNKSLWVKYLLEDIETSDPQKIADIVLNEAIDNNYGNVKDDMTILVYKFIKI